MKRKDLQIDQLESKMKVFAIPSKTAPPSADWLKPVRTSLGMTLQQLTDRLKITQQSAGEIE